MVWLDGMVVMSRMNNLHVEGLMDSGGEDIEKGIGDF